MYVVESLDIITSDSHDAKEWQTWPPAEAS